jgi:Protein of unknown function (DUF1501)
MLTMLGSPRRCCDGLTRRETLKVGALSLLGGSFNLPSLLALEQNRTARERPGKAKSVILLYLLGGAATQDMWDLKPDAPVGVRSEFKPINTNVPGVRFCEHLPNMAKWMHKSALVRSVNHKAGCHNCLPSYTGFEGLLPDQHPRDSDPPSMGSVCEYFKHGETEFPAYVYMPCWLGWGQAFRRAGPYGGFLGQRYDPLLTECAPYHDKIGPPPVPGRPAVVRGAPLLPNSNLGMDLTIDRLNTRQGLLHQLDDQVRKAEGQPAMDRFDRTQHKAFSLLTSTRLKAAFNIEKEDPKLLDRYGRTLFGHSTLIARRLVEEGVRFVNVTWDLFWDRVQVDYDAWDTHTNNFSILRDNKLPHLDHTVPALMQDLDERGLLDETLVVIMSEMGRTPRVNPSGGRDHWTFCYSVMFAGAGIRGGAVCGASDSQAAYVKDRPVSTGEICATIFQCLGIDPHMTVNERSGRPVPIAQGADPIREILA